MYHNFRVILNSKDIDPVYKERTRQQVIHLAFIGEKKAIELVGKIAGDSCPCADCTSFYKQQFLGDSAIGQS